MKKTLLEIAKTLNTNHIHWAVGGSLMLECFDLATNPQDIDLIVSIKDIKQADALLSVLGKKKRPTNNKMFATDYFYQYEINKVNVDLMAGFKIIHEEGIYAYPFDQHSIGEKIIDKDVKINYCALEDWYVLYALMPNRKHKTELLFNYLKLNPSKHSFLLKRALQQPLPEKLKENIHLLV